MRRYRVLSAVPGVTLKRPLSSKDGAMPDVPQKIYCAGPLFTEKERQEMAELASALEDVAYRTFLPQRDGLELTKCVDSLVAAGFPETEASRLMARAIFALDVYQVLHGCDALVANLNGRVPDEGTVSEASMAWSRGKVVVAYKADSRTAFGGQDNPLVTGLFGFHLSDTIDDVVSTLQERMRNAESAKVCRAAREEEIDSHISLGSDIASLLEKRPRLEEIVEVIVRFAATSANT